MTGSRWARWAAASGTVFAVLFVVGMLMLNLPGGHDSDQKITSFYDDQGNRVRVIVAAYLLAAAGLAFLLFVNHLRGRLRATEDEAGWLSGAVLTGGVVFVGMLFAAGVMFASVAGAVTFGDTPQPDSDVSRMLPQMGFGFLLLYGSLTGAFTVAAASFAMQRSRMFPAWLPWLGFVAAVVLLFGVLFFPLIALPVWVLAVSSALIRTNGTERRPP